ncbi:LacI family DNA-binding transcriptional regulator [Kineococcus sp. SYSU DK002]|uniref:LacI family DNA-binding transcriptional regulator n=1 Tax=Kineococcus sp. SYSU DK002 TaxID=3383123 RepID=UPI003D7CEB23
MSSTAANSTTSRAISPAPLPRRRATAVDIARAAGVSRATVSFVLNDTPGQTISEPTRRRVLEAAEQLGYRPHRAAQALGRGRSKVVLMALPDWPVEHSMRQNMEEAASVLDEAGYSLATCTLHAAGHAQPLWELLDPDVVLGIAPFTEQDVASMRRSGVAQIVPDPAEAANWITSPAVTIGPRLQVDHLHAAGHRQLGFAAPLDPRLQLLAEARLLAVRERATELGLPEIDVRVAGLHDHSAEAAVRAWKAHGVSAVAAYNDELAAAVAGAALRHGLSVPGELAIIGHDDSPLAQLFVPSLSSVRLDNAGLGRYLAELALHAADGRPLAMEPPDAGACVVARESTQATSG